MGLGLALALWLALAGCVTLPRQGEGMHRYAADGAGTSLGGMEFILRWDGLEEGQPVVLTAVSSERPREMRIERIELSSRRAVVVKEVRAKISYWRWAEKDGRYVASVPLYGLERADRMLRFGDDVSIRLLGRSLEEELEVVFDVRSEEHADYASR